MMSKKALFTVPFFHARKFCTCVSYMIGTDKGGIDYV